MLGPDVKRRQHPSKLGNGVPIAPRLLLKASDLLEERERLLSVDGPGRVTGREHDHRPAQVLDLPGFHVGDSSRTCVRRSISATAPFLEDSDLLERPKDRCDEKERSLRMAAV